MRWTGYGRTDQGLVRASNQDAFLVLNDLQLWAVADGMGGHPGGDVASRLAVETIADLSRAAAAPLTHRQDRREIIGRLIREAHRTILKKTETATDLLGMGTTVVVAHIASGPPVRATIAHLGDSRAYIFRRNDLIQLTRDHSVVETYVDQGIITPQQAASHPARHLLDRALGIGHEEYPDVTEAELEPDDLVLLCTDGLTKMLEQNEIVAVLQANRDDPDHACAALIEAALASGGEDNVTVVICAREQRPLRDISD